ncbi:hypothetical protein VP01_121g2 [Puccinia sorghi]|uniref:Uncharacterized protein n=1 Tax=Puccinia sorghi TaxID=27349 RepID=A0A0L6VRK3_9BASI|nr:hypothetical protein VP01_121g2 [Puccinia sorghi]
MSQEPEICKREKRSVSRLKPQAYKLPWQVKFSRVACLNSCKTIIFTCCKQASCQCSFFPNPFSHHFFLTTSLQAKNGNSNNPSCKTTKKKKPIPRDCDGVDDSDSSIMVILNWLITATNYQHWSGNTQHGKTKRSLCSKVLDLLKENGVHHHNIKGMKFFFFFSPFFHVLNFYFISGITWNINNLQSSYNTSF